MQPIIIDTVSQDQFNAYLRQVERDFGFTLPKTNTGSYAEYGVEIAWNYNPAGQTVTLECKRKPFWLPESVIFDHMQSEINKLRSAA